MWRREPDFIIGNLSAPYLRRWWLIPRNRWLNVYLHHFLRSDDDKALHCHPWHNVSVLLSGSYIEHTPKGRFFRQRGAIVARRAEAAHRIELYKTVTCPEAGEPVVREAPVWTLFITGRKFREWGFYCPKGWVHWRDFVSSASPGQVGKGCTD